MQLFYKENISESEILFDSEESRHLTKVLRKKVGDSIQVTDGKGLLATCTLQKISSRSANLLVKEKSLFPKDDFEIHLIIAPTKSPDRMEWMLEKATEIGLHRLTLIDSENSERHRIKTDRLEKKMVAACKQSLKFHFPEISPFSTFAEILENSKSFDGQKFIAHVDEDNDELLFHLAAPKGRYWILIGPEGDFSKKEISEAIDSGFVPVSLGKSRLRTETAGLASVHILNLVQDSR